MTLIPESLLSDGGKFNISAWTSAHHLKLNLSKTELLFLPGKNCPHMDLSVAVEDITVCTTAGAAVGPSPSQKPSPAAQSSCNSPSQLQSEQEKFSPLHPYCESHMYEAAAGWNKWNFFLSKINHCAKISSVVVLNIWMVCFYQIFVSSTSLFIYPTAPITIKFTWPVMQITWWHHLVLLDVLATFRTANSDLQCWGVGNNGPEILQENTHSDTVCPPWCHLTTDAEVSAAVPPGYRAASLLLHSSSGLHFIKYIFLCSIKRNEHQINLYSFLSRGVRVMKHSNYFCTSTMWY